MVSVNPIQFTIVSAVPLLCGSVFCATKVENRGESAMTTIPQKTRHPMNTISEDIIKINGDIRQHIQESSSAVKAIFFVPKCSDK